MPLNNATIDGMRSAAEKSLFYFSRVVLGLKWLTPTLHREMCEFLQSTDKHRKLGLVPRDHAKSTLVKCQILHIMIQPQNDNLYFPGIPGTDTRIILAGEVGRNVSRHLSSIEATLQKNKLIHTLWPHVKIGAKKSQHELELVRSTAYSEPTVEALGTDTAIASRHVDWIFCDDIYTFEAMMSSTVSERVNLWFDALEPILDETENTSAYLTVTGTPWSERDVYKRILSSIEEGEDDYAVYVRSVIENHQPIWPERFSLDRLKRIERRQREHGLWMLNWMCLYGESEFNDFRVAWLQDFVLEGKTVVRSDGERIPLASCDIVTCYDPARTRASEYGYLARNAIMTTACDQNYNVYVLAYYAKREALSEIYTAYELQCKEYHPRCVGVEDVATQIAIGDAFEIISRLKGHDLPPVVPLHPDTSVNKKWRIKTSIQRVASYQKLYIQSDHFEFKAEWGAFPNGRTIDILDVLAYCIQLHNIPDDESQTNYNDAMRQRMLGNNMPIDEDIDEDDRYKVPGPPANVRLLRSA